MAKKEVTSYELPTFTSGDFVVYPAHGVGKFLGYESQEIADQKGEFLTVFFEKDRMTLRLPPKKAAQSGLRPLTSKEEMNEVLQTLTVKPKVRRAMWSRRAQDYETKINSGDPLSIAEVVRELYKNPTQSEQSYSERQIYQAALERLGRELAAIEQIDEISAFKTIEDVIKVA